MWVLCLLSDIGPSISTRWAAKQSVYLPRLFMTVLFHVVSKITVEVDRSAAFLSLLFQLAIYILNASEENLCDFFYHGDPYNFVGNIQFLI